MDETTLVAGDKNRGFGRWGRILALCGFYGALLAALAAMAAGLGSRGGLWHFRSGFEILTWAARGALAAALISLLGVIAALKERQFSSGGLALLGLVIGMIIFAVPFSWRATARELGWKIVAAVPAEERIEATETTFWFGFTDDIVIRITTAGHRSLVDIRSVSRVGRSDAGTNAKRIRLFMQHLSGEG